MNRSKGFTLAELAIALVIIALLLAGAMMPLSTQIEVRNIGDTQRTMDSIKEAIVGFALANGRLPCPANGALASGTAGAGLEQLNGPGTACSTSQGVVPWAALGAPEADSWGRRFTYHVSPAFADAVSQLTYSTSTAATTPASPGSQTVCAPTPTPTQSSFALCSLGDAAVLTRSPSSPAAVPMGTAVAAVLISHGKNGYGAWQTNGIRLTPLPSNDDEASNMNGATTVTAATLGAGTYTQFAFFSRDQTPSASGCSDPAPGAAGGGAPLCEFDDILVMISAPTLMARMVGAGKLP
jgi:prepilin-type N-terminal cleavage/methylation domain-containing protein